MTILCVLLPHFPYQCELLRGSTPRDCPALIAGITGSQKLVLDCSPQLEGLQSGMPLQEALSRHKDVRVVPADLSHYRSIFSRVLDGLEKKSPLVEESDLGCAYLGIDGLEKLYGGEEALVAAVRSVVPGDFTAHFGVGPGKLPAYLAALSSPPEEYTSVKGDAAAFIKDFPCNVLPISWKDRKKLAEFGLHTLGQVAALPPGPLQAQFGPRGRKIWELSRGNDKSALIPRRSTENIEESLTLPSMVTSLDAIMMAVESLLSRVFAKEALRGKGISTLAIWGRMWCSGYWERVCCFKNPACNTASALFRIRHVLEVSPLPGPVEELGLRVTELCRDRGHQRNLFSEVRSREQLQEDIRQMELRLGGPQVFRVREVEPWSRIPERRQALASSGQ